MQLNKRHVHVKTGDMVLCVFLQHLMTSLVPGVKKGIIFFADIKLVEKQHDILISEKKILFLLPVRVKTLMFAAQNSAETAGQFLSDDRETIS